MTSIEAVIFDFGGVFTTSPVENFAVYERENALPERFIGGVIKSNINDGAFSRYERAEISLDDFDQQFADETRAAGHEITGRKLLSLMSLTFHAPMIKALERVKKAGLKTGCITNNMPSMDNEKMVADPTSKAQVDRIYSLFDHIIESSKAGMRKPEPRIYEAMCTALAVAPDSCVFIDDLGVNLKPARTMGMQTIKAPFGDITPAVRELEEMTGLALD